MERGKILFRGWKILFRDLLKRRKEVVLLSLLGIISGLANGVVPYTIGQFFDALIAPESAVVIASVSVSVWALLAVWAGAQFFSNGADWIIDTKRRYMGTFLRAEHTAQTAAETLELPVTFFKNEKIGEIIDRIQRSSNALAVIVEQVVIDLAPQFLSVVVGVTIAFFINPWLALVLIAGVTLYILTLVKIVPPLVVMQKEGQKAWRSAWGNVGDAIGNFQTVKQSGAEQYERKRLWEKFVHGAATKWNKVERVWVGIAFYQRSIVVLTQLIVFALSILFIQRGDITPGELIALTSYAGMIFRPFATMGQNWQIVQNGLIALEQTEDMLLLPREEYAGAPHTTRGITGAVAFEGVFFGYDEKTPVLKDISFSAQAGEVVALVGESGVGKSTTIELISGYYRADTGNVLIDGKAPEEIGLRALRKQIAVVPQEPVLFNDTIRVNIAYGDPKASMEDIKTAVRQAHAHDFIKGFPDGYEQLVGERGIKLSVGQKQRIAIARAFLREPRILILDEPTSALDARTEQEITKSLEKLMKGRTTFIIAHRLSTVRRADKILVFDKGKIVETGTHDVLKVKKDGVYRRLYEYQIGLY